MSITYENLECRQIYELEKYKFHQANCGTGRISKPVLHRFFGTFAFFQNLDKVYISHNNILPSSL